MPPSPTAYRNSPEEITGQAIAPLLAAVPIAPGTRMLDVACGTGPAAAAAAALGAVVQGVDLSAAQLARATAAHPAIAFHQADAAALPFADAAFDMLISNFGVPHFADPPAFLAEAYRVLRPGGWIAFTAWISPDSPAMATPTGAGDTGPSFFAFGDPAHARRALTAAGFVAIATTIAPVEWRGAPPDGMLDAVMAGIMRAAGILGARTPQALAAIQDRLRGTIEDHTSQGAFALPMPARITCAQKPTPQVSSPQPTPQSSPRPA